MSRNITKISQPNKTIVESSRLGTITNISSYTPSSGASAETAASIKTKYESNPDTNAFTDSEKAKVANQSGTNTGDQDISGITTNANAITALDSSKADKTNVLERDNSDTFTPSADYHPATKKYVDDNAGGGSEFLDTEFRIVDNSSGYKLISDTSNLTQDITVTYSDFNFNFEDYFDSDGTVIKFQNNVTIDNTASNIIDFRLGLSSYYRFLSSIALQLNSSTKLGWCNAKADTTLDTTIERKEAGVIGLNGGISYTALSADPSDPADGESVTWVSDGTDSGGAGDVMIKVNVGGTVKIATLIDYSTL